MRAAVAESPGRLSEVVTLKDVEPPAAPRPDEVRVRMIATTVNPSDAVTISGAYASRTHFPFVPGFEGLGVVEDGSGRRVLPLGGPGCWQQLRNVERHWCVPVPEDIADTTACFSYINPLTASLMVNRFCAGPQPTVLVTAAASAIAGHIAELLTSLPLTHSGLAPVKPLGLVRHSGLGSRQVADPSRWKTVIGTDDPEWRQHLRAAAGPHGVDVILDCIGGPLGLDLVDALAPGGVLVLYGLLSGEPLPVSCSDGRNGTRVEMFRLRDIIHSPGSSQRVPHHPTQNGSELADLFTPVFTLLRRGLLHTPIARRVGLSEFHGSTGFTTALRDIESGGLGRLGKLLIDPWE